MCVKSKQRGGEERGYHSDVSVDDSDNDPDFVLEEPSTPVEVPVNVGASTLRRNIVESTPVAGGSVGESAVGSGGGSGGSSSSKKRVVKIGRSVKLIKTNGFRL